MSTKLDELAAQLLALAAEEGRNDYIKALQGLIPLKNIIAEFDSSGAKFNDEWRQRFTRDDYDSDAVRALFSKTLLQDENYRSFLVDTCARIESQETKHAMILNFMSDGKYGDALQCFNALSDKESFKNHVHNRKSVFTRLNRDPYFYTTGDERELSRDGIVLLNGLGLETPDNFDGSYNYGNRKDIWSASKFDAVVDWVSDLAPEPPIAAFSEGKIKVYNCEMLNAFFAEKERVAGKGEWHQKVFPKFVPVIVPKSITKEIEAAGGIVIEPDMGSSRHDAYYGMDVHECSHGFTSLSGLVKRHEIVQSLTLLSYETIQILREDGADVSIALFDSCKNLTITDSSPGREILSIAMKYHRPELFHPDYKQYLGMIEGKGLHTKLYLRGIPEGTGDISDYRIEAGILQDERFLDYFNSELELRHLIESYNPDNLDRAKHAYIKQDLGSESIEASVNDAIHKHNRIADKLGFAPAVTLSGTDEFLLAVAERVTRDNIQLSNSNNVTVTRKTRSEPWATENRLSARLGELSHSNLRNMPVEDLIVRGARIKDKTTLEFQRICGILDRIGVPEIAKLARTPGQRAFVVENFDVSSHLKDLPKAVRLLVGGAKLQDELGM